MKRSPNSSWPLLGPVPCHALPCLALQIQMRGFSYYSGPVSKKLYWETRPSCVLIVSIEARSTSELEQHVSKRDSLGLRVSQRCLDRDSNCASARMRSEGSIGHLFFLTSHSQNLKALGALPCLSPLPRRKVLVLSCILDQGCSVAAADCHAMDPGLCEREREIESAHRHIILQRAFMPHGRGL